MTPAPFSPAMQAVEHVVILMLENRSFDHMLGALSLPPGQGGAGRADVLGLRGPAVDVNQYDGAEYPIFPLLSLTFGDEPCHDSACVQRQLRHDNGGFVFDFEGVRKHETTGAVMGYQPVGALPVYDFFVREFVLCDRWHCSVPGPTWPNRLYSLAGESDGQHDNTMPHLGYGLKTILEYLDDAGASHGYYAHDQLFSFLRAFRRYAVSDEVRGVDAFYADAQAGTLPAVSWVEPDFGVRSVATANDDHPPASLARGQALTARVYNALRGGPRWTQTLLLITYDEHGGFYDHVVPPACADARADFRQYGVRVPAFVVSPWVARGGLTHTIFDHTSLLRTVLDRFCGGAGGAAPSMGVRADSAAGVWPLLTEAAPRDGIPTVPVPDEGPISAARPAGAADVGAPPPGIPLPTNTRDALLLAVGGAAQAAGVRPAA